MLEEFTWYCNAHPNERFWQALRNWCGWSFVYLSNDLVNRHSDGHKVKDTFYLEGRNE